MDSGTKERLEQLKDKIEFAARRITELPLVARLESLSLRLETSLGQGLNEIGVELDELAKESPELRAALDQHEEKSSVDRAEGFLADLAEDRSSAPPEIVPLIDQYITSVRDVIARAWERHVSRRELDACVLQVRISYSRDLDRILQALI